MTHKPQEKNCAERFVEWYNAENASHYNLCETEEYFPGLRNNKGPKWDYVDREEADPAWIAIEVKQLFPDTSMERSWNDWRDLCAQITKDVQGKITGIYSLISPPPPGFTQNKRKRLCQAIANVVAQAAPTMMVRSQPIDLGPKVAEQFPDWPRQGVRDLTEYDRWGEDRPHELEVWKESDEGCQVKLALLAGGWGPAELNQALDQLFAPKDPQGGQANAQLGAAKEKGASKTILLLYCPGGASPNGVVRDYAKLLDPAVVCNIDCIYLVETGDKPFSRVL